MIQFQSRATALRLVVLIAFSLSGPSMALAQDKAADNAAPVGSLPGGKWHWQTLETTGQPTARHETTLVNHDGKFYLIGGRESRLIDRFDPLTQTWETMGLTTPLIQHFQSVVWDDKVYMVGAMTGIYPTEPQMERVQLYDPRSDTWTEGDPIPEDRRRGGADTAVYNGTIYIACGSPKRGGGQLSSVEISSPRDAQAIASESDAISRRDLFIRDPFIVPDIDTQTYYLYRSAEVTLGNREKRPGVVAFTSKDLEIWHGPKPVFHYPDDCWAGGNIWAPEVHHYQGKYYLFATFNSDQPIALPLGRPKSGLRATQICVSDSLSGPFRIFDNKPHTPTDWLSLDGTLWVEDGIPYMVFCHEWVQLTNGTINLVQLSNDLSHPVGKSQLLFAASDAAWGKSLQGGTEGYVTDGCFLYRTKTGRLLMIWSSFGKQGYTVGIARSTTGKVAGSWEQVEQPLLATNGGHGMIFKTFDGRLIMPIHQPNSGPIRMRLYELADEGDSLRVKAEIPFPEAGTVE